MVGLTWGEGALRVAAWAVAAVALGMLADWLWELPRLVRLALLWVYLVSVGLMAWRWVRAPLRRLPDRDWLALYVENRRPELRSRLISAVQLARTTADTAEAEAFVGRLAAEAFDATRALDPVELAPAKALRRRAWMAVPVLVGTLLLFVAGLPDTWTLWRRVALHEVPVPRQTRLVEVTGARVLGRGDELPLVAVAEGLIPRAGEVTLRHESGRRQTLVLDADPQRRGRFERVLANVPASFFYRVRVNDAVSEEFFVEVLPRPVVTNVVFTYHLPAYTGLPARRVAPGELTLLRGSRLVVEAMASQPLRRATARVSGIDGLVNGVLDPADPSRFTLELAADDSRFNGFSLELEDARGIPSRESAAYAVDVVPDRPPQVRILLPSRREELVTPRGTALLSFEARDDFGLASLRLRHRLAGATNDAPATVDLVLDDAGTNVVRRRFDWKLGTLKPPLPLGAFLEFWVEATDRNDRDGPGVGASERYLLRVVSEAEKRSDLLSRAGDAIGRLGDVAQGQERLTESLGRIILARPPTP